MLFQLKQNDQKDKLNQQNFSKIEKFKYMLSKVKFVAKNVIYLKKWSNQKVKFKFSKGYPNFVISRFKDLDISLGSFSIKI